MCTASAPAPKSAPCSTPRTPPPLPPAAIRREDYRPPDWLVPDDRARVRSRRRADPGPVAAERRAQRRARPAAPAGRAGAEAGRARGRRRGARITASKAIVLTVALGGEAATVETLVEIAPRANTQLMGLYEFGRHPVHPVRGRGLPADHALPRPARRALALPGADDRRQGRLSGAAVERRSGRRRASSRAAATGPNGTIPSPSPAICSPWSPATSPPIATASSPARAARSISASGCARPICPRPSMPWPRSRRR